MGERFRQKDLHTRLCLGNHLGRLRQECLGLRGGQEGGQQGRRATRYLQQEKGRDDVVGHVEVVPNAGLVEREPLKREHQLGGRQGRDMLKQALRPWGQPSCKVISRDLLWQPGDKRTSREGN
jgi:hypothetical protein